MGQSWTDSRSAPGRGVARVERWFRALLATALLALAFLVASCASSVPSGGLGAEADFLQGQKLFEDRRYFQAVQSLETFRTEHPGSERVDDAIFLLGKAHQNLGENLLAREEFDRLLRDFPQSEHRESAQFERAMSWMDDARAPSLDPEPLQEAMESFRAYLRNYPDGAHRGEAEKYIRICLDRLAVKAYQNGRTYLTLNKPSAARIYFEKSLSILSDSSKAPDALLGLGKSYEREGNPDKAREAYQQLLDLATPERIQSDRHLRDLRRQAEEALAGSPTAARRGF